MCGGVDMLDNIPLPTEIRTISYPSISIWKNRA